MSLYRYIYTGTARVRQLADNKAPPLTARGLVGGCGSPARPQQRQTTVGVEAGPTHTPEDILIVALAAAPPSLLHPATLSLSSRIYRPTKYISLLFNSTVEDVAERLNDVAATPMRPPNGVPVFQNDAS